MRKSQIITLIILFILVTLFIWVGACSDKSEVPDPDATVKINTPGATTPDTQVTPEPPATSTPEPVERPEIDSTKLSGLGTAALDASVSESDHAFTGDAIKAALNGSDYILSDPGTDTKDIYISFFLTSSAKNTLVTQILDTAASNNARFTFFVSKSYIEDSANLEIISRIHRDGHTIGTCGDISIDGDGQISDEQLEASAESMSDALWAMETKYQQIFGPSERMQFYAADRISERNIKLANMMGYTVAFRFSKFVTDEGTRSETYNGVLFQNVNMRDTLPEQLSSYVTWATSEGYTFKALSR